MMNSLKVLITIAVACTSMTALAADLSPDETSELRARADGLLAERNRNPDWDGGTTRLNRTRSDVNLNQNQGEVKTPRRGEVKTKVKGNKVKREPLKKRMKRTVKDIPGALVR